MIGIVRFTLALVLPLLLLGTYAGLSPAQTRGDQGKWEFYDKDRNGVRYHYDKESITFVRKNVMQVRRQRVFPPDASYKEIITLDEIDCQKQRYRTLEMTVKTGKGETQEFKKVTPWAYIYVGMPEDYFLDKHCP